MLRYLVAICVGLMALAVPALACEAPAGPTRGPDAVVVAAVHATLTATTLPDEAPRLAELVGLLQVDDEAEEEEEQPETQNHWLMRQAAAGTLVAVGAVGTIIAVPLTAVLGVLGIGAMVSGDPMGVGMGLFGLLAAAGFAVVSLVSIGMIAAGVRIGRAEKRKEQAVRLVPTGTGVALLARF